MNGKGLHVRMKKEKKTFWSFVNLVDVFNHRKQYGVLGYAVCLLPQQNVAKVIRGKKIY